MAENAITDALMLALTNPAFLTTLAQNVAVVLQASNTDPVGTGTQQHSTSTVGIVNQRDEHVQLELTSWRVGRNKNSNSSPSSLKKDETPNNKQIKQSKTPSQVQSANRPPKPTQSKRPAPEKQRSRLSQSANRPSNSQHTDKPVGINKSSKALSDGPTAKNPPRSNKATDKGERHDDSGINDDQDDDGQEDEYDGEEEDKWSNFPDSIGDSQMGMIPSRRDWKLLLGMTKKEMHEFKKLVFVFLENKYPGLNLNQSFRTAFPKDMSRGTVSLVLKWFKKDYPSLEFHGLKTSLRYWFEDRKKLARNRPDSVPSARQRPASQQCHDIESDDDDEDDEKPASKPPSKKKPAAKPSGRRQQTRQKIEEVDSDEEEEEPPSAQPSKKKPADTLSARQKTCQMVEDVNYEEDDEEPASKPPSKKKPAAKPSGRRQQTRQKIEEVDSDEEKEEPPSAQPSKKKPADTLSARQKTRQMVEDVDYEEDDEEPASKPPSKKKPAAKPSGRRQKTRQKIEEVVSKEEEEEPSSTQPSQRKDMRNTSRSQASEFILHEAEEVPDEEVSASGYGTDTSEIVDDGESVSKEAGYITILWEGASKARLTSLEYFRHSSDMQRIYDQRLPHHSDGNVFSKPLNRRGDIIHTSSFDMGTTRDWEANFHLVHNYGVFLYVVMDLAEGETSPDEDPSDKPDVDDFSSRQADDYDTNESQSDRLKYVRTQAAETTEYGRHLKSKELWITRLKHSHTHHSDSDDDLDPVKMARFEKTYVLNTAPRSPSPQSLRIAASQPVDMVHPSAKSAQRPSEAKLQRSVTLAREKGGGSKSGDSSVYTTPDNKKRSSGSAPPVTTMVQSTTISKFATPKKSSTLIGRDEVPPTPPKTPALNNKPRQSQQTPAHKSTPCSRSPVETITNSPIPCIPVQILGDHNRYTVHMGKIEKFGGLAHWINEKVEGGFDRDEEKLGYKRIGDSKAAYKPMSIQEQLSKALDTCKDSGILLRITRPGQTNNKRKQSPPGRETSTPEMYDRERSTSAILADSHVLMEGGGSPEPEPPKKRPNTSTTASTSTPSRSTTKPLKRNINGNIKSAAIVSSENEDECSGTQVGNRKLRKRSAEDGRVERPIKKQRPDALTDMSQSHQNSQATQGKPVTKRKSKSEKDALIATRPASRKNNLSQG
ncbi:hypothetical protein BJ508DRAFT_332884 [Ascobolus immersus RN42]|uniref:Uncharacterized protein n=1 Tax=Ascobolus immersus RN42 TaxID=1160509 RepID=A0A3N4HQ20_ASCIM|nr:hypothetical protein BJ508DRAFT_332884 [Ascobolus immersus RN42]